VIVSSLVLIGAGVFTAFLPGVGRPAAEWRRAISTLRHARPAPAAAMAVRPATLADFDRLAGHLPALGRITSGQRSALLTAATVREVPAETTIVGEGEIGDAAYFILDGHAVAGTPGSDGEYRSLSAMAAGDFFGEIAALTGSRRTANVVADEPTTVLEVPASSLRALMSVPELGSLFLSKLTERLNRTNSADLPRFSGLDQASLKDLRTPRPAPEALANPS
jgi:hypothetical protein